MNVLCEQDLGHWLLSNVLERAEGGGELSVYFADAEPLSRFLSFLRKLFLV